jgi:hypothetical protein
MFVNCENILIWMIFFQSWSLAIWNPSSGYSWGVIQAIQPACDGALLPTLQLFPCRVGQLLAGVQQPHQVPDHRNVKRGWMAPKGRGPKISQWKFHGYIGYRSFLWFDFGQALKAPSQRFFGASYSAAAALVSPSLRLRSLFTHWAVPRLNGVPQLDTNIRCRQDAPWGVAGNSSCSPRPHECIAIKTIPPINQNVYLPL